MLKKVLSLALALIMAFSVCTVMAQAEDAQNAPDDFRTDLYVYDLLKYDVDPNRHICRSIELMFQNQFCVYDVTKPIRLLDEYGAPVAVLKPQSYSNHHYDLYNLDGDYGVQLSVINLYYIHIPQGAYTTAEGVECDEYLGEYSGWVLTGNDTRYTVRDAEISNFLPKTFNKTTLFYGKILINPAFRSFQVGRGSVALYHISGKNYELLGHYPIVALKNGVAEVDFGDGVSIDKYEYYVLRIRFGGVLGSNGLVCDHSDFELSGKKLLGLREDIPWLDFLINAFGAKHWTVSAAVTICDLLSKIGLVDKGYAKDVKNYVDRAKRNGR